MYPSIFLSFGGLGFYQFICCSFLPSTHTDEEIRMNTSSLPHCQGRPALQPLSELQTTLRIQLGRWWEIAPKTGNLDINQSFIISAAHPDKHGGLASRAIIGGCQGEQEEAREPPEYLPAAEENGRLCVYLGSWVVWQWQKLNGPRTACLCTI